MIYYAGGFMEKNRIVTELFFEKPSFENVSQIAKQLEDVGIKTMLLPPNDRKVNTHLIVDPSDLEKARAKLNELGVKTQEKEVMLIYLENKPGSMAEMLKKISDKGINLTYAFSVAMNPEMSFVLLGAEDNKAALELLES